MEAYTCTVQLQGKDSLIPLTAEVNTGSSMTTITDAYYKQHLGHAPLKLPVKMLCNCDQSPVKGILGTLGITAYFSNKKQHIRMYVMHDDVAPVMG